MVADSLPSTLDRWMAIITKVGAAGAVFAAAGAGVATIVHFIDKVPK